MGSNRVACSCPLAGVAVGMFGFFTMNLLPDMDIREDWGPYANTAAFASVAIPASIGSLLILGAGLVWLFRTNVLTIS